MKKFTEVRQKKLHRRKVRRFMLLLLFVCLIPSFNICARGERPFVRINGSADCQNQIRISVSFMETQNSFMLYAEPILEFCKNSFLFWKTVLPFPNLHLSSVFVSETESNYCQQSQCEDNRGSDGENAALKEMHNREQPRKAGKRNCNTHCGLYRFFSEKF